ncbi:5-deoxy-glucuronate isomerase [Stackebrandtia nassauensis]|uniref:Myo-inositol catabolism IolB domain protein n=1 Tax=Stackebrandtia nassauensis (strain DSM 44728 / CIP 108903 / NRRL B-16338 / NBRC 102104 / LLR-40K-21) TaxID=446470 RepID=D3Q6X4_STANL|nr:5-deoxy-glucuronate isomerase [Stackebrandtia nassauensis]ADD40373.1 Myo-inositol catabolism IolB domain protein [Stackebrandtia nassauensis DSM 44728]
MNYHLPAFSTSADPYETVITPDSAGWHYSGLLVLTLEPGDTHELSTGDSETLVLPLNGGCVVECEGQTIAVTGRASVFSRVSDFVYLPRDATATISSAAGGRFALPSARCERRLSVRYGAAEDVPVELRGAGQCSRQVNNFCTPDVFPADRLIACEVLTPGANWSSYPPHKHDRAGDGECELEEIYYFEVDGSGMGYQRVYGSDRPIDVLAEVRGGDVVLIPHGWHGPAMATPGYDLYYLNVMAGPGEHRAWLISDDPAHGWIRDTWRDLDIDPRLPLTSTVERRP